VRSLDRDYSFAIRGLFDTAIAAQLAGARQTGLANVLLSCLGLELAKPKRLQRTDWSRRPLEPEELDYAAADVAHLLPLADALRDRLQALGRTDWVTEECARQERERYRRPDPPEEAFLSVRGARDLDDRGRAVLRELCVLRECEARGLGRPPYRVMSESALVDLAGRPTTSRPMPAGVDPRLWRSPGRRRLQEAIARGHEAAPVPWPKRTRSVWSRQAQVRLRALKEWRHEEASRLDLDAGVVWPADHLKQLALHPDRPTADLDPECDPPCVRQWQWRELGPSLEAFRRESLGDRV
jgi:ribonuclease D